MTAKERLTIETAERPGKRGSQGEGEGGSQDSGQHNHAFKGEEIKGRGTDKKLKAFKNVNSMALGVVGRKRALSTPYARGNRINLGIKR